MVDYATVFGVLFLLGTLAFTYWITRISLANDAHGPRDAGGTEIGSN
jgi:hypothetical protein